MADLLLVNPWWENPGNIELDRYISAYRQSLIQWQPEVLSEFDFNQDAVYTLRGPRQVGKTTLTKMIIRDLLKSGVSPMAILYYSCDLIPGAEEVFQLIRQYHEFSQPLKFKRRYVFLDEISLVPIDFHILYFTRPEGGGCIVIRRRPITQRNLICESL